MTRKECFSIDDSLTSRSRGGPFRESKSLIFFYPFVKKKKRALKMGLFIYFFFMLSILCMFFNPFLDESWTVVLFERTSSMQSLYVLKQLYVSFNDFPLINYPQLGSFSLCIFSTRKVKKSTIGWVQYCARSFRGGGKNEKKKKLLQNLFIIVLEMASSGATSILLSHCLVS